MSFFLLEAYSWGLSMYAAGVCLGTACIKVLHVLSLLLLRHFGLMFLCWKHLPCSFSFPLGFLCHQKRPKREVHGWRPLMTGMQQSNWNWGTSINVFVTCLFHLATGQSGSFCISFWFSLQLFNISRPFMWGIVSVHALLVCLWMPLNNKCLTISLVQFIPCIFISLLIISEEGSF